MDKYCNRKTYELRYSDFDFKDELTPYAVLALAQESAAASADELGFGYNALKRVHCGFIVVNTYCEFRRPIPLGTRVTVETWPLPPRHVIFERDSRILGEDGEELVAIAARWCLVDLNSFTMLTPDRLGAAHENCPYRAERTTEPPAWKIPNVEGEERMRRVVRVSDCDHYFHANNAKYADFFLDLFSSEELACRRIKAFQISYERQAKEGQELVFTRADFENNSVCAAHADGENIAKFRIWFTEDKHD